MKITELENILHEETETTDSELSSEIRNAIKQLSSDPSSLAMSGKEGIKELGKQLRLRETLFLKLDEAIKQSLKDNSIRALKNEHWERTVRLAKFYANSAAVKNLKPLDRKQEEERVKKDIRRAADIYLAIKYIQKSKQVVKLQKANFNHDGFLEDVLDGARRKQRIEKARAIGTQDERN